MNQSSGTTQQGSGANLAKALREGDRRVAPAVLNLIETRSPEARRETDVLVRALSPAVLGSETAAHIVGITGPPGVGKSSLLSNLIPAWRVAGQSVAVLAVDPTSRRSGGALLGDRARISVNPDDDAVFMRSTAAGDRLGGVAPATRTTAHVLASAFDIVVIETVGVGQSETDISEIVDTVVVVVQPAAGDVLQFLKAGIMEIPDMLVVTKSDLGKVARRTYHELKTAIDRLERPVSAERPRVLSVSSIPPVSGITELISELEDHRNSIDARAIRASARRANALAELVNEYGARGLRLLGGRSKALQVLEQLDPDLDERSMLSELEGRLVN